MCKLIEYIVCRYNKYSGRTQERIFSRCSVVQLENILGGKHLIFSLGNDQQSFTFHVENICLVSPRDVTHSLWVGPIPDSHFLDYLG